MSAVRADDAIHKHWDGTLGAFAARVLPGQYYVTGSDNECIATVLGSCVSACIRDPGLKVGGMNHFMLPGDDAGGGGMTVNRYGAFAMENLINDILKKGGNKSRLEIMLFGRKWGLKKKKEDKFMLFVSKKYCMA